MAERGADMLSQGGYEAELPAEDRAGAGVVGEPGEVAESHDDQGDDGGKQLD